MFNNYFNGTDTLGVPDRKRFQTDDSIEVRYYNKPEKTGISKMAMSFTADCGLRVRRRRDVHGGNANAPKQSFAGWMAYNRIWFHKDLFAITLGGGMMNNPGRYLTLLPPINGADAISGSPYFTATPGNQAHLWDAHPQLPVHAQGVHHLLGGGRVSPLGRAVLLGPWRHHASRRQQRRLLQSFVVQHRRQLPARAIWRPRRRLAVAGRAASGSPICARRKPRSPWASW